LLIARLVPALRGGDFFQGRLNRLDIIAHAEADAVVPLVGGSRLVLQTDIVLVALAFEVRVTAHHVVVPVAGYEHRWFDFTTVGLPFSRR